MLDDIVDILLAEYREIVETDSLSDMLIFLQENVSWLEFHSEDNNEIRKNYNLHFHSFLVSEVMPKLAEKIGAEIFSDKD